MTRARLRLVLAVGLLLALALAGVFRYYANSQPDGLERVATDEGFAEQADEHALSDSPLADYGTEGVENDRLSVGVAGVVGTVAVLVLATALAYFVRWRSRTAGPANAAAAPPSAPQPGDGSPD